MSPTDYLKDNVRITSARKLLYGSVFKKFQIRTEDQQFHENLILGAVKVDFVDAKISNLILRKYRTP